MKKNYEKKPSEPSEPSETPVLNYSSLIMVRQAHHESIIRHWFSVIRHPHFIQLSCFSLVFLTNGQK
jgi:hypothetical protein